MMEDKRNKTIVQRFFDEVVNGRNVAAIDELFTVNYSHHDAAAPDELQHDRDGYKKLLSGFLAAFPDLTMAVEDWIVRGDTVVARWSWTGTHRGPLGPIPPTGKRVSGAGIDVRRLERGRIAEGWVGYDTMSMMRQLGLVPPPGEGKR